MVLFGLGRYSRKGALLEGIFSRKVVKALS
jgi:hypothetical protein